jgi:hypothetical protein
MSKKLWNVLIKVSAAAMAIVYALQYFNAFGHDENKDIFNADDIKNNGLMQLFAALSALFAFSQLPEIYDHIPRKMCTKDRHKKEEKSFSMVETCQLFPRREKIMRSLGGITGLTLTSFALIALWRDSKDLARDHLAGSIFIFMLSGGGFLLLQGRHVFALVMGRQKQLMETVTERYESGTEGEDHEMMTSPGLQTVLFIIYTLSHIADSALLVNDKDTDPGVYWLSVIGLSTSVACYNLTHTLNVKSAYYTLMNLPSTGAKITGVGVALVAGCLEASQTTLGFMGLLKQPRRWLLVLQGGAIAIEFTTGFIEASQHASQRAALWINRRIDLQRRTLSFIREDSENQSIPSPSISRVTSTEQDELKNNSEWPINENNTQEEEKKMINSDDAKQSVIEVEMKTLPHFFSRPTQPDDMKVDEDKGSDFHPQATMTVTTPVLRSPILPSLSHTSYFSMLKSLVQGRKPPLSAVTQAAQYQTTDSNSSLT